MLFRKRTHGYIACQAKNLSTAHVQPANQLFCVMTLLDYVRMIELHRFAMLAASMLLGNE